MSYILLVGIHGVGKTTLLNKLKDSIDLTALSISDLIRQAGNDIKREEKHTTNIQNNQFLWKEKLKEYSFLKDELVVLDGHFTLLDKNGDIVELPFETFDGIDIRKIVLKRELPSVIKDRLENRDRTLWNIDLIDNFQEIETKRAQQFSVEKNIRLLEINDGVQIEEVLGFLKL
ncbi:ATP-binding protein [Streptococcus ruminantium]|uniref:ATP-binding protein n=1 Tax=Streptococcus ruminantium TaxID=1917441 RepID=UPI0012DCA87A|nr:ATP-binding protein [Streptococcus ruminantium]